MMNKKILAFILMLTMLLTNGCQLAKEEASNDGIGKDDCLVGLLITEGQRGIDESVYATVDKKNSEDPGDWEITFPGVEGISFFVPEFRYGDGEHDSFIMVVGSDEISDVKNCLNVSDTGSNREITGNIYVGRVADKEYIYYMNPVYQTVDGEIYVTQGQGLMGSEAEGTGALGSWNVKEEKELKVNGKATVQGISVDVTFEMMYIPTEIRVHQMDMEHNILVSQEYEPGTLPEEVKCEEQTAYVLVETDRVDLEGKSITEREMCTADDEGKIIVETFSKGEFGALKKQMTTFINY